MAVCWFHSTVILPEFRHTLLGQSGLYGYLGVQVFFVISGFIVPYAMVSAGYKLKDVWTFLVKRLIRVEPPYLFSIALGMFMSVYPALFLLYNGEPPKYQAIELALHLGYLIPFFHQFRWINGVYWSLAVEFQYYLAISLLLPALVSRRRGVRMCSYLLFAGSSLLIRNEGFLPMHAPLFALGCAGMLRMIGLVSWREFLLDALLGCVLLYRSEGLTSSLAGIAALTLILSVKRAPSVLLWLGDISYSLYLVHDMIGRRIIHLVFILVPGGAKNMAPFLGVLCSLLCALVMFRLIELPAKRIAARIKYDRPANDSASRRATQCVAG